MAIVVGYSTSDSGKRVVHVAGEDFQRPQVVVAHGMEDSPELQKALDLAANHRAYASTHRFASAKERGRRA
jgi:hypothetical protein